MKELFQKILNAFSLSKENRLTYDGIEDAAESAPPPVEAEAEAPAGADEPVDLGKVAGLEDMKSALSALDDLGPDTDVSLEGHTRAPEPAAPERRGGETGEAVTHEQAVASATATPNRRIQMPEMKVEGKTPEYHQKWVGKYGQEKADQMLAQVTTLEDKGVDNKEARIKVTQQARAEKQRQEFASAAQKAVESVSGPVADVSLEGQQATPEAVAAERRGGEGVAADIGPLATAGGMPEEADEMDEAIAAAAAAEKPEGGQAMADVDTSQFEQK